MMELREGIDFKVRISNSANRTLEFQCIAADEIEIDRFSFVTYPTTQDSAKYRGREFGQLDDRVQDAFFAYLEDRCVDADLGYFILAHAREKNHHEYMHWMRAVTKFVQKA